MSDSRDRLKIYQDEAKLRHTTHWDWDYLSAEEYEALMEDQKQRRPADLPPDPAPPQPDFPFAKVLAGLLVVIALLILALYLL